MPPRQSANKRGLLALGFAVVGVVTFAGAAVVGLRGPSRLSGDGPPLLTADAGPSKSRPDQPGGMEVPHQDILAYERLRDHDGGRGNQVERLLPPPEVPLPRPVVTPQMPAVVPLPSVPSVAQLPPGATATVPRDTVAAAVAAAAPLAAEPAPGLTATAPSVPPAGQVPSVQAPQSVVAKPQQPPAAPAKPAPAPQQQVASAAKPPAPPAAPPAQQNAAPSMGQLIAKLEAASLPAAPAKATPQPAKPAAAPAAGGSGGWRVQLASVRSEGEAAAEWRRLAGRHPDALGGLSMQVARVDLGEKGIFYRVQGAGADEARAKSACTQLRAQNVGCVVVRP
ncbi:SPOR domain-containing protein [Azospirillum sp. 412522]|nr:SPOR domain-containing protein [Azospirillum sp. 412522]